MYGTTIKSYNESKSSKIKKNKNVEQVVTNRKESKKQNRKEQDTKYMKIPPKVDTASYEVAEEDVSFNEGFSFKDLPIASVVITVVLTMMMLVMTSGFGGL